MDRTPIPVLWLFGKTGSGKSTIVRYLTGVDTVEIGNGFQPQTKFTSSYDFPCEAEPILRFLDTRGLGEVDYDPTEDIQELGDQAHLMIVTVRAMDHALEETVTALKKIRKVHPQRPVLLALTTLHEAYPGQQHPKTDPFDKAESSPLPESLCDDLKRSLELQYERFAGLYDRAVPLDITPIYEGFEQPFFGGERLNQTIIELLPAAYRHQLIQLEEVVDPLADLIRRKTMPTILGMSSLAATAAAVPFPWIDIPVVMGIQTHLIYKLAKLHDQPIDGKAIAKLSGALSSRIAVRMAIRESLKFIPWVGMATNAAASFAMTFATGMAWNWYFTEIEVGHIPNEDDLQQVFQEQLLKASQLWKSAHNE